MKRRLKINGVIVFCAILLLVFFPAIFFRYEKMNFLDEIAEICGIVFILLGQILRVSARGHKSEHSSSGNALIQEGPYSLVRNPMYLGILLIGIGVVLMLFYWWVTFIFLLVFVSRYILLIFKEEKELAKNFPKDYSDYQRRVPRILPSMGLLLEKDISDYLPLKLSWLKKEMGSILTVLFITLLLESWEDIRDGGIRTYFREAAGLAVIILLFMLLVAYLSRRRDNP